MASKGAGHEDFFQENGRGKSLFTGELGDHVGIKGIGPVMAKRIAKKFGKETLDVIEHKIEKLGDIEGIGRKRISMIKKAWNK